MKWYTRGAVCMCVCLCVCVFVHVCACLGTGIKRCGSPKISLTHTHKHTRARANTHTHTHTHTELHTPHNPVCTGQACKLSSWYTLDRRTASSGGDDPVAELALLRDLEDHDAEGRLLRWVISAHHLHHTRDRHTHTHTLTLTHRHTQHTTRHNARTAGCRVSSVSTRGRGATPSTTGA